MDEDLAAQFAALGVAVSALVSPEDEGFEIMLANADTLRAWLACSTQWRVAAGMAGLLWLGLDYAAVDVVLRRLSVPEPDAVFADLQVMEDVALATLAEERA